MIIFYPARNRVSTQLSKGYLCVYNLCNKGDVFSKREITCRGRNTEARRVQENVAAETESNDGGTCLYNPWLILVVGRGGHVWEGQVAEKAGVSEVSMLWVELSTTPPGSLVLCPLL